ncbi:DUF222 domain-containing protein [Gordonia sp. CPCC 205515]|uniref:DUF222 domain-containing protein n=1 Tax=Gordonia sp. CPCC 205515 TaxID=3140791 RepID=UPI003AF35B3F
MPGGATPDAEVTAAYAALHAAIDRIAALDTTPASDAEVVRAAEMHEHATRRLYPIGLRRVGDVSDRDAHRRLGHRTLSNFMTARLRITDPKRRQDHMAALLQFHALSGDLLDPKCPTLAQAAAEGAVGPDHIHAALDTLDRIPAKVSAEEKTRAEAMMADFARDHGPAGIEKLGARILAHLDPDGTVTDDADRARQRGLNLRGQDAQLMSKLSATLDPLTRAMLDVVIAAWAAPGMNDPDHPDSPRGSADDVDDEVLREAARRDLRSQSQRNHDALKALLQAVLDGGLLGTSHRGLPPHLIIKVTEEALREQAGVAETTTGAVLPISDVIELAAKCQQHLAVFEGHRTEVLYLGRANRFANRSQRFALFAADGGCSAPDCDQPFATTEAHHAQKDWAQGGWTDIIDLAPACPKHNRMVGHKRGQFTTHMVSDGPDAGRAAWTLNGDDTLPPNQARINRSHDLAEALAAYRRGERLTQAPRGPTPRGTHDTRPPPERRRVPKLIACRWSVTRYDPATMRPAT